MISAASPGFGARARNEASTAKTETTGVPFSRMIRTKEEEEKEEEEEEEFICQVIKDLTIHLY